MLYPQSFAILPGPSKGWHYTLRARWMCVAECIWVYGYRAPAMPSTQTDANFSVMCTCAACVCDHKCTEWGFSFVLAKAKRSWGNARRRHSVYINTFMYVFYERDAYIAVRLSLNQTRSYTLFTWAFKRVFCGLHFPLSVLHNQPTRSEVLNRHKGVSRNPDRVGKRVNFKGRILCYPFIVPVL